MSPNKKRADELRKLVLDVKEVSGKINLKNKIELIWPKISLIYAIHSGPFEPLLDISKSFVSKVVYMNSVYVSTEGFHAIGIGSERNLYIVGPPSNSFMELIPQNKDNLSETTVIPSELKVDQIYEVVITSPMTGLIR